MFLSNRSTLFKDEYSTFVRLFIPLLDFINQKFTINNHLGEQLRSGNYVVSEIKKVAAVLWEKPYVIDEYIEAIDEQFDVETDDRLILESWKHPVSGQFILERHLDGGSVFIKNQTKQIYVVKGLTEPWSKTLSGFVPPVMLEATLIPFRDCIITDGLSSPLSVHFGVEYRNLFTQYYLDAIKNGSIITHI